MLIRIIDFNKNIIYINPSHVVSVEPAVDRIADKHGSCSVIEIVNRSVPVIASGTPDEVVTQYGL